MKVLLVHNDYGKYSGEEAVVDKMAQLFSELGHEVVQLRMSTADARNSLRGKIRVFTSGINSPSGVKAMRRAIEQHKPDVVNVHNVFPFISPAALRECKKAGVPVIMTVHNFRLICPTGLFMRNGAPCEICLEKGNEWSCVKYNCEQSRLKSLAYAARNALARRKKHFLECVDTFACITDFQRRKLIAAGFPQEKITVIPNSIDASGTKEIEPKQNPELSDIYGDRNVAASDLPQSLTSGYVAFCGRISHEKGIDLILEAARNLPDIPFKLAGAVGNPSLVENLPGNVELLGYVNGEDLVNFYRNSRFVIMASRCYEGFPVAILEAARFAKPTIGPDHGGFTEIIKSLGKGQEATGDGQLLLFKPGDAQSLTKKIRYLWDNPELAENLGQEAHIKLETSYSTEVVAKKWAKLLSDIVKQC